MSRHFVLPQPLRSLSPSPAHAWSASMRPAGSVSPLEAKRSLQTRKTTGSTMEIKQQTTAQIPHLPLALSVSISNKERDKTSTRIPPLTQRALYSSCNAATNENMCTLERHLAERDRPSQTPASILHLCTYRGPAKGPHRETLLHAFAQSKTPQRLGDGKPLKPSATGLRTLSVPRKDFSSPRHLSLEEGKASRLIWEKRLRLNLQSVAEIPCSPKQPGSFQQQQKGPRRLDPNEAIAMRDYTLRLLQYSESLDGGQQQSLAQQQRRGHLTARPLASDATRVAHELHLMSGSPRDRRSRVQSLVKGLEARRIRAKKGSGMRGLVHASGSLTHRPRLAREESEREEKSFHETFFDPVAVPLDQAKPINSRNTPCDQLEREETLSPPACSEGGRDKPSVRAEETEGLSPSESRQLSAALARGTPERMVGSYLLGRTIGEGTFGKVRVATHMLTGESVAVKVLEKDKLRAADDAERVLREIHILKGVRHPHIIHLLEIVETASRLYLVMEFASGGELFDFIVRRQRVDEQTARRIFRQILSGVEALHSMSICHRDLKPENLLLDSKMNIKIVDFGLSNLYRNKHMLKTACGSPSYAAPEIVQGKLYSPLAVDIWSCGVILYALLVGRLPFEENTTEGLYRRIISGTFGCPSFVSPEACSLLRGILHTCPLKRFGPLQIKQHPWLSGSKGFVQLHRRLFSSRWPYGPPVCCVSDCRACMEWLKPASAKLSRSILEKMPRCNFSLEALECHIRCHPVGPYAATYHLLSIKQQREEETGAGAQRSKLDGLPLRGRAKQKMPEGPEATPETPAAAEKAPEEIASKASQEVCPPPCAALQPTQGNANGFEKQPTVANSVSFKTTLKASCGSEVPLQQQLQQQRMRHQMQRAVALLKPVRCHSESSSCTSPVAATAESNAGVTEKTPTASGPLCNSRDSADAPASSYSSAKIILPHGFEPQPPHQACQGVPGSLLKTCAEAVGSPAAQELPCSPFLEPHSLQLTSLPREASLTSHQQQTLLQVLPQELQESLQQPVDNASFRSLPPPQVTPEQAEWLNSEVLKTTQQPLHCSKERMQWLLQPEQCFLARGQSKETETKMPGCLAARVSQGAAGETAAPIKQLGAPGCRLKSIGASLHPKEIGALLSQETLEDASKPKETDGRQPVTAVPAAEGKAEGSESLGAKATNPQLVSGCQLAAPAGTPALDALPRQQGKHNRGPTCGALAPPGKTYSASFFSNKSPRDPLTNGRMRWAGEKGCKAGGGGAAATAVPRLLATRSNTTTLCSSCTAAATSSKKTRVSSLKAATRTGYSKTAGAWSHRGPPSKEQLAQEQLEIKIPSEHKCDAWRLAKSSFLGGQQPLASASQTTMVGSPQASSWRLPQGPKLATIAKGDSTGSNNMKLLAPPLRAHTQPGNGSRAEAARLRSLLRKAAGLPVRSSPPGASAKGSVARGALTARALLRSNASTGARHTASSLVSRRPGSGKGRSQAQGDPMRPAPHKAKSLVTPKVSTEQPTPAALQTAAAKRCFSCCGAEAPRPSKVAGAAGPARPALRMGAAGAAAPARPLRLSRLRSEIAEPLLGTRKLTSKLPVAGAATAAKKRQLLRVPAGESRMQQKTSRAGTIGSRLTANEAKRADAGKGLVPPAPSHRQRSSPVPLTKPAACRTCSDLHLEATDDYGIKSGETNASSGSSSSTGATGNKTTLRCMSTTCRRSVGLRQQSSCNPLPAPNPIGPLKLPVRKEEDPKPREGANGSAENAKEKLRASLSRVAAAPRTGCRIRHQASVGAH